MTNAELIERGEAWINGSDEYGPKVLMQILCSRLRYYEELEQMEREADAEYEIERPIPLGEAPGDVLLFDECYPLSSYLKSWYSRVRTWERDGQKHHVFSCHPQTTEAKEGTGILSFEL
jgi:hypothetical protein